MASVPNSKRHSFSSAPAGAGAGAGAHEKLFLLQKVENLNCGLGIVHVCFYFNEVTLEV